MTTEYISGQGRLFQVLTSDEMLENDVAAEPKTDALLRRKRRARENLRTA
jgi:hypothetical protein